MISLTPSSQQPYGRCEAHHGRHGTYMGRCVLVGGELSRPFTFRDGGHCGVCGVQLDLRYERGRRHAAVLVAGTDTPHGHSSPSVSLDATELAEAIVLASRAARQQPRQYQEQQQQQPPQQREAVPSGVAPSRPLPPASRQPLGGIPEFDRDG